jgi:2-keto-4-pentenoate hydratase/2-oxohepta-3-ene-1,7-dioic acid hydratase in catechol pathway
MFFRLRDRAGHVEQIAVPVIYCVGLNYLAHAHEMNSPRPAEPVIFLKPSSSLLPSGGVVQLPVGAQEVHHELELVVAIDRPCRDLSPEQAHAVIAGYGVGLDMTWRDRQAQAKAQGKPWAVAKGFASSAPLSELISADQIAEPEQLRFELRVNGEQRQQGCAQDMLFSVPELVAWLSGVFDLQRGDLIYTGTPSGVGPVVAGDQLVAALSGWTQLAVTVTPRLARPAFAPAAE